MDFYEHRTKIILAVFALVVLGFWGFIKWNTRTIIYKGDKVEERSCRVCDGKRTSCQFCGGDNKVTVITPGPNRPMNVVVEVYDQHARYKNAPIDTFLWTQIPGTTAFEPPRGAIGDAEILVSDADGKGAKGQTRQTGCFVVELLPGTYKVSVTAPGYRPWTRDVEVEQVPVIWMEEKRLPRDFMRDQYGITPSSDTRLLSAGLQK